MRKEKLNKAQIDKLSFERRTLIKSILKYNINIYNENSLENNLERILPVKFITGGLGVGEAFIINIIYKGKNVEPELINVALRDDYFIIAYDVFTDGDEEDEVHFLYSAKDFSFKEVRYFKEADELEGVWT